MIKSLFSIIVLLCVISCTTTGAYNQYDKSNDKSTDILSELIKNNDFNNTLHSDYLKHKVLSMADTVANTSYFTISGHIRDHKKREFIFIEFPPIDHKEVVLQARKLKKLSRALLRTNDGDYQLAGKLLLQLSNAIAQRERKEANRLIALFEDFYAEDLVKPNNLNDKDQSFLKSLTNSVVDEFKSIFSSVSSNLQKKAIGALNLEAVLGRRIF